MKEKIETADTAVQIDDAAWSGHQIETDAVAIHDPGEGDVVFIRHFFFAAKPAPTKPTKQQLFAESKNLIATQLWADGLEPIDDMRIEVHTRGYLKKISPTLYKKMFKEKSDYVIMVPCRPKKGFLLHEKPLRAWTNKTPTNKQPQPQQMEIARTLLPI